MKKKCHIKNSTKITCNLANICKNNKIFKIKIST